MNLWNKNPKNQEGLMDTFELFIHIVQDDKQSSILLLLEVQNREEVSAEGEQSFV